MRTLVGLVVVVSCSAAQAGLHLPAIFGDQMVLQRDHRCPVWGWTDPGTEITVAIGKQSHSTKAAADGAWRLTLDPMKAGGPHTLKITAGKDERELKDVLIGEVWICSGQSNMAWPVARANDPDLESLAANFPKIRLISVPQVGTQTPQKDFKGAWAKCTPQTVKDFSAVGFFFGRQLHQTLNIPIGLIDNAWGGSAAEAWIPKAKLEADKKFQPLLERWAETVTSFESGKTKANYEKALANWRKRAAAAREAGKRVPRRPRFRNPLTGNHRPANIWNGVLKPTIGYGIRGVIWYQGESNASRAYQYRDLFPLMISTWREAWGQGDFPFYWVQLADFLAEKPDPGDSAWAELREAQTMTQDKLPNTGQAVIIDIGEANDIHPRNKLDVAKRLSRLALAKDYGIKIPHLSPRFDSMSVEGSKATVKFKHTGTGLKPFDVNEVRGFAIAGKDKKWHWAKAVVARGKSNQVVVSSDAVPNPVAVRYAWADNPVANLRTRDGLPVTPFRTDTWPGVTVDKK